jgi:hypothetical protein
MAENAALKQPEAKQRRRRGPGRRWQRGESGNPAGKKPGTRNRATMLGQELLDAQAPKLVRKAISMALKGDTVALRICLDRIVPIARHRTVQLSIPPLRNVADASAAMASIVTAISNGELTPDEGNELSNLVANFVKTLEVTALEQRIEALEKGSEVGIELTREELARKLEERGLPTSIFGIDVPVLDPEAETQPVSGNGIGQLKNGRTRQAEPGIRKGG